MNGHFYKAKHAAAHSSPTKRLEGVHISGPSSPTGVYRSLQEERKEYRKESTGVCRKKGRSLQERIYKKDSAGRSLEINESELKVPTGT